MVPDDPDISKIESAAAVSRLHCSASRVLGRRNTSLTSIALGGLASKTLRVVSLNLGGRNTNPLEFELKGDSSGMAVQAMAMLRRAGKALQQKQEGPAGMPDFERKFLEEILAEIYRHAPPLAAVRRWQVEKLFDCETWMEVLEHVKEHQPNLFNVLNLSTLKLRRPSVWEDPASCASFTGAKEYLEAWQSWYRSIDRSGPLWLEELPLRAAKRNIDVATGFAGLLIFDVMCLHTARVSLGEPLDEHCMADDREVPFGEIARFTSQLPASSLDARHEVAEQHIQNAGAHVVFAQEARKFAEHTSMAEDFLPFTAADGFTAVFLHRDIFPNAVDIGADVSKKMEAKLDPHYPENLRKAWHTTTSRLAGAYSGNGAQVGGFNGCFVSLHCSHSECTASFLEALRDVLADYDADINIVGVDSNCPGKEAAAFQRRLRSSGFEVGNLQDQVTVVKQRTYFQTQIKKAGETDISHKDYIVSWGSMRVYRGRTIYTPDLRTAYGVEQHTKQCVRLPTIRWPFDHCSAATTFTARRLCKPKTLLRPQALCKCFVACLVLSTILLPFANRKERPSWYGEPGTWHVDTWPGTPRVGLCEASTPLGQGCEVGWTEAAGTCHRATPKMSYDDADSFCQRHNSSLVSIGSEAENRFLTEQLCPEGEFCWIGLRSDKANEQSWWVSGEPMDFSSLVVTPPGFFPIFPASRDTDREVAVLSTLPAEICGCRGVEYLVPTEEVPVGLINLRLAGIGLALVVSTALLLAPRPQQESTSSASTTTKYLAIAFCVNYLWFLTTMWDICHAAGMDKKSLAHATGVIIDQVGHALTGNWAYWIVLRRHTLLYPARVPRIVFIFMVFFYAFQAAVLVLFMDINTTLRTTSVPVLLCFSLTVILILLYVAFCVPIASDLYQTWTLLKREARIGRAAQLTDHLDYQVRAAGIHFFTILIAVIVGALRWGGVLAWLLVATRTNFILWTRYVILVTAIVDSIANDACAYLLAACDMDESVVRAKGITMEVVRRANLEVEQHRLAVSLLKAAPTSQEQLHHLAQLEDEARAGLEKGEYEPFLVLQSAVQVESARIHGLMRCVRSRAMIMPLRYKYLIDIPAVQGDPRQHVPAQFLSEDSPEAAADYFDWLYAEADGAQQVFFHQVKQLVASFNKTPWPTHLGLVGEQFPWTIWPNGPGETARKRLQSTDVISAGDILLHEPAKKTFVDHLSREKTFTRCFILEESPSGVMIHRSGSPQAEEVPRQELRRCNGGAIFVPGPKKKRARCQAKIATDYEGSEPFPAAASLADICRCMILLDDPYAIAVFVAYLRSSMRVVRIKNRFNEDVLEETNAEELQSMFFRATAGSGHSRISDSTCPDTACTVSAASSVSSTESTAWQGSGLGGQQYRDIACNVEIKGPSGLPFICEIQVTLSNLAILKHADTRLYTIRRMKTPKDLLQSHAFSKA